MSENVSTLTYLQRFLFYIAFFLLSGTSQPSASRFVKLAKHSIFDGIVRGSNETRLVKPLEQGLMYSKCTDMYHLCVIQGWGACSSLEAWGGEGTC